MISDLDEALRRLLVRELPVLNHEVDIRFDQPSRQWSGRLNGPTLDLFLHDLRENTVLRQPEWDITRNGDGTMTRRRTAVRMDLHYMITAWVVNHPDDEHRLLTRTLMALFRSPTLPDDLLPESLQDQPVPIALRVAQQEEYRSPADIWSALDNELRPAIACTVTLALNPYRPLTGPLVRTRDLRFGQATGLPDRQQLDAAAGQDRFWMVGGNLHSREPLDGRRVVLTLVERGLEVPVDWTPAGDGRFVVGNLEAGEYTLEVSTEGQEPTRHTITVPSPAYDLAF